VQECAWIRKGNVAKIALLSMIKPLDKRLQKILDGAMSKRARAVVEHIIKHGSVTTEDLEKMGYNHPPRAVGDVRDCGIPLITTRVKSTTGKSIAVYKFDDFYKISNSTLWDNKILNQLFRNLVSLFTFAIIIKTFT